jgi:GTP-binding protein Era
VKSAFVAIIGRPSAGKSTLLNKLCAQKVSIVSRTPQTTRNAIRGIVNRAGTGQLVFIDTPGMHSSGKKMNKKLMDVSKRALEECDIVLYVMDSVRSPGQEEEEIARLLEPLSFKTIAALNKTDAVLPGSAGCEKSREFILSFLPKITHDKIIAVSALTTTILTIRDGWSHDEPSGTALDNIKKK